MAGSRRRGGGGGSARGTPSGAAAGGARARTVGASPGTGRGRGRGRGGVARAAADASDPEAESECASIPEDAWFDADEADADVEVDAGAEAPATFAPSATGPPAQAFALAAAPMYPNSVKWSEDNLIAVAAGHMVTILNPASLSGPRSFVPVSVRPNFDFGTVGRDDLKNHLLMPLTLSRDSRPVVRCIDWSPQGVASNGGCLLAVGTTDYRVKLYCPPISEYRAEWVEVADLSEFMFGYCMKCDFLENEASSFDMAPASKPGNTGRIPNRSFKRLAPELLSSITCVEDPTHESQSKRRRTSNNENAPENPISMLSLESGNSNLLPTLERASEVVWDGQAASLTSNHLKVLDKPLLNDVLPEEVIKIFDRRTKKGPYADQLPGVDIEGFDTNPMSEGIKQNRRKKQQKSKDGNNFSSSISAAQYIARSAMLTPLVLAWSPKCYSSPAMDGNFQVASSRSSVFLAVGTKSGMVGFWRILDPRVYSVEKVLPPQGINFIGLLHAHDSWITVLDWAKFHGNSGDNVLLATGSSDGSVKLWLGDSATLMNWTPSAHLLPWTLLAQVTSTDSIPVTSMALKVLVEDVKILLVVGKGSGSVSAWDCTEAGGCSRKACQARAHDQAVMGLCWTIDGNYFYSCGQDNLLQMWEFTENHLVHVESSLLASEVPATAPDLPASALESFFGVALSPANLALAMVRGIAAEVVDPMYQSRSQKGVVQLIWVGGQDDAKPDSSDDAAIGFPSKSIYTITASWEPRIISALHHFGHHTQSLVLWDVLTVLSFLKGICGNQILGSVFRKWLPSWKFVNTGAADVCCWSTNELKTCLPSLSCRYLQMIVVIYRRIVLQDLRIGLLSEGLEAMQNSASRTQLTQEQQLWLDNLWCIEHELRERLMFLALWTALWFKSSPAENVQAATGMENRLSAALLMSDWISFNSSKVSPQLLQLAIQVHNVYNRRVGPSGQYISQESCSFCDQTVPLEYVEVGYCRSEGISTRVNHRLQRCSTSMRVCPPGPLWFCTCCARNASEQAPELFFSLTSSLEIERLPSIVVLHPVVPRCPFCGILMQRNVPEFFLTPSLV